MRLTRLLPLLLALPGCTSVARPEPAAALLEAERRAPVTILVSIDGFRPDYLRRGDTAELDALADRGVAASMRPSFPSLTFPNHYTLVTGLRPDRHGVVGNTMEDPARPGATFTINDAKQVGERFWWDGAEPIWVAAERAGVRTGTMFWPGAEAAIGGVRPSVWVPYNAAVTGAQRVDFVLDWLRRPAPERPRLLTLYFDVVDKTSHNQGYASPEKTAAIREVDANVRRLREGLARLGQPANLVIVSDHGMTSVPPAHFLDPRTVVDETKMRVQVVGPILQIYPKPGQEAATAARVVGAHPHARCWRREDLPARFRYGRNPRVAPFYCLAELGWRYSTEPAPAFDKGDHGFDPDDPSMAALFLAVGPAFRSGVRLATFDNVDVYPLLRDLVGLPPKPGLDGNDTLFKKGLNR